VGVNLSYTHRRRRCKHVQALRMRTHRGTETTCWEQARGGRFRAWSVAVCGAHAPRRAPSLLLEACAQAHL